jgi:hypothetical protein
MLTNIVLMDVTYYQSFPHGIHFIVLIDVTCYQSLCSISFSFFDCFLILNGALVKHTKNINKTCTTTKKESGGGAAAFQFCCSDKVNVLL